MSSHIPNSRKLWRTRRYYNRSGFPFAFAPSDAPRIRRMVGEGLVAFLTWLRLPETLRR